MLHTLTIHGWQDSKGEKIHELSIFCVCENSLRIAEHSSHDPEELDNASSLIQLHIPTDTDIEQVASQIINLLGHRSSALPTYGGLTVLEKAKPLKSGDEFPTVSAHFFDNAGRTPNAKKLRQFVLQHLDDAIAYVEGRRSR